MIDEICCGTTCNREVRDKSLKVQGATLFVLYLIEQGSMTSEESEDLEELLDYFIDNEL